jgi:hypothetical protein
MDFLKDEGQARGYLARYLAAAPDDHPQKKDANQRMSELGPAPAPASQPGLPAPASRPAPKKAKRRRPRRRLLVAALLLVGPAAFAAPPAKKARPAAKPAAAAATTDKPSNKEKTFDFAAMGIEGKVLAPQLLYLLGRIKVELDKGSLEGRSFMPELERSVDEGGL